MGDIHVDFEPDGVVPSVAFNIYDFETIHPTLQDMDEELDQLDYLADILVLVQAYLQKKGIMKRIDAVMLRPQYGKPVTAVLHGTPMDYDTKQFEYGNNFSVKITLK